MFSDEMAKLNSKYDGDLDVTAVYAEAIMVRRAWALWVKDKATGTIVPADNNTLLAKDALEKVRQYARPSPPPPLLSRAAQLLYCAPFKACDMRYLAQVGGASRLHRIVGNALLS